MPVITLPHNWSPRPYQARLWNSLESGTKRAIAIAHRRWGKDEVALHWAAVSAAQRPATLWHMLPQISQGRRAIWNAVNPHTGKRRIDEAFPKSIRESTNENEMFIRFKNGSTWTVTGSDAYDSLVGSPPAGIVFSEWSRANPSSWAYLAPILVENNGWALFITTPLGNNHAKSMYSMARNDPAWFAEVSTVADTNAISLQDVEAQRKEYHALFGEAAGDALIEQEYYCSFDSVIPGSYYAKEMTVCEREGRVCQVDVDRDLPVHSAWDLGVSDSTAIWCFQVNGPELQIVDYYEASGHGAEHYCEWLNEQRYRGVDWVPHDARVREWGSGRSRLDTLRMLGRRPRIVPAHSLQDGINAARRTIPLVRFDAARCARGIDCLKSYQAEWSEELRTFKKTPLHDWASHGADAFRYLAMSWRESMVTEDELSPLERLRQEIMKPKTYNDMWRQYAEEQVERGIEPDEHADVFNLSNTMEMK
jgi:phage terminase large subunit